MRPLELVPLLLLAAVAGGCAGAPRGGGSADPAALYRAKCSACHRLVAPETLTRDAWSAAIARMAPKAHLRDEERERLLGWLHVHAKDSNPGRTP